MNMVNAFKKIDRPLPHWQRSC